MVKKGFFFHFGTGQFRRAILERFWLGFRSFWGGPNPNPYGKYWYKTHVGLFWTVAEKRPKIAKTRPTKRQKSIKKHKRTSRHFVAFCGRDFFTFLTKNGPQRGGWGASKTQKNAKNRLREISWFRPALRERFWRDLGVLWHGLLLIFGDLKYALR